MINFINYLLVFICTTIFSSKNYLFFSYVILNILLIMAWFIVYFRNKKKYKVEIKKQDFDINVLFLLCLIIASNFIGNLEMVNLVFGFVYFGYFSIKFISSIKKKDYAMNELSINSTRIFDVYTIIYLTGILFRIFNYQI